MEVAQDSRKFSRAFVGNRVEIALEDNVVVLGRLNDVSMGGLFVTGAPPLFVDDEYAVSILLQAAENTFIRVYTRGRITRVTEDGMAFRFIEIDENSLTHLHNLVMYNADDPDRVVSESPVDIEA